MPDNRDKLPDHKKSSRQDSTEVDCNADSINASSVPIPLARSGTVGKTALGCAGNIEVGETSQDETNHCACEDDDYKSQDNGHWESEDYLHSEKL